MFRPRISRSLLVGTAITVLTMACSDSTPTAPAFRATAAAPARITNGIWRDTIIGNTGPGSTYGLFMPNNWNGDVVYYAHGFVAPQLPVGLPSDDIAPLRDGLGQMGYAVAYSSFSENGYDFPDAAQRTHQLRGMFTSKFGNPKRAFLVGHSLGGQVVQSLAETYGKQYDGALSLCGLVGGTKMEVQYIGQLRTAFDFFYPGVLPGNTTEMPQISDVNGQIVYPALGAIQANPNGFGAMAQIAQTQMAGRDANEMVTTLLRILGLHALEANDFLGRTHGHTLFDNSTTQYVSPSLPGFVTDAMNAGITRYTATADATAWLNNNYQPTGRIQIPMVTLHLKHDWLVPFAQEAAYAQIVSAAGNSGNLRQRTADGYGHCDFTPQATVGSFLELVQWVTTGVAPAP